MHRGVRHGVAAAAHDRRTVRVRRRRGDLLGTLTREDGSTQVTYHGHPLYRFAKDEDSSDTYGQGVDGFGARWWVVAPTGEAIPTSGQAVPGDGY